MYEKAHHIKQTSSAWWDLFPQCMFQQFQGGFFGGGGVGAQFATENTGEDGFFQQVDLLQHSFGSFLGLLFFG